MSSLTLLYHHLIFILQSSSGKILNLARSSIWSLFNLTLRTTGLKSCVNWFSWVPPAAPSLLLSFLLPSMSFGMTIPIFEISSSSEIFSSSLPLLLLAGESWVGGRKMLLLISCSINKRFDKASFLKDQWSREEDLLTVSSIYVNVS